MTPWRLLGNGDLVAFFFAQWVPKFEMRNILETVEFILQQVDPKAAEEYLNKGDVTFPKDQQQN